jgi:hypothetical protein
MKAFDTYVQGLEKLYLNATKGGASAELNVEIAAVLDGQAGRELRRLVPVSELRAAGAFFTGSVLAAKAAARLMTSVTPTSRILDPACGAGDLLVACSRHLPTARGFRSTLVEWGRYLLGRDLQPAFVAAARYRLALAALTRHLWAKWKGEASDLDLLSQVTAGCGLKARGVIKQATHIILNPPFSLVPAPAGCEWTSGNVSAAAVFLDECLRNALPGTRIVAILPDVLRSGERYGRWRERIVARARIEWVELFGQFDRRADVDVFLLEMVAARIPDTRPSRWQYPLACATETVGDRFDISVGSVVPFRHPQRGRWHRYVHARGVPAWGVVEDVGERRRFRGTVHGPPFVVVRRTSRVGDKNRAVGTVISGTAAVAVENHLLVLRPKDGQFASCEELLKALRSPRTNEWLDGRIRCRHLTVSAIRELPFWEHG